MKKGSAFIPILAILSLLLIITSLLAYRYYSKNSQPFPIDGDLCADGSIKLTCPTPSTNPSENNDETANWKTYTNEKMGFALDLPAEYKIDDSNSSPTFYKGLKFTLPKNSPADPYTTALGVNERTGTDALAACEAELCYNLSQGDNYKKMVSKINTADAIKIINTDVPLHGDYYISNKNKVVRVSYGTYRYEGDTRSDDQMKSDFERLEKIISTFKFL